MGMDDPPSKSNVVSMQDSFPALERRIRSIVHLDKGSVKFQEHAEDRSDERKIFLRDVFNVLKHGCIEGTKNGRNEGETKIKMRGSVLDREITVIVVLTKEDKLLIVTNW
jgi:hypothetical protein